MPSISKDDCSRPRLRGINTEKSTMNHIFNSTPNELHGHINKQNWRILRYSNAKTKRFILAVTATLLALIWFLPGSSISFSQRGCQVVPPILEVFQVYAPILTKPIVNHEIIPQKPNDHMSSSTLFTEPCNVVLMEHSFGFSYGEPFVGEYVPPKCKFNKVTMNFTVTSKGRQFDRLAIMYFNNTEVWRTSTAEPTFNGIRWEYVKDLSAYMGYWEFPHPQKIIFDLGNLVNDVYTGVFNTTLTATFSMVEDVAEPATEIVPISAHKGSENQGSVFILPADRATNWFRLPRNIRKAVVSISACGQAEEEFWWANTLQSDVDKFANQTGTLYGLSPFREVQLLIDGKIAGVQWPFPVVFTGGVVPGLWRPIVGIDAFDLRNHEIDISPWLGVLCDGEAHLFEIRVTGISDDGQGNFTETRAVGNSWYVTGNIFLWMDEDENSITNGTEIQIVTPPNHYKISSATTKDATGKIQTLEYTTNVTGGMSIYSKITTQKGTHFTTWTQDLSVTNIGRFTNYGLTQETIHNTTGKDAAMSINRSSETYYGLRYSYPLYANTSFSVEPSSRNFTLDATLVQGLELDIEQASIFFPNSPSSLSTTLEGSAHYFGSPQAKMSTGHGSTNQTFKFETKGKEEETYSRDVRAVNGTVVKDIEGWNGVEKIASASCAKSIVTDGDSPSSVSSPRQAIGRGPGEAKEVLVTGGW